MLQIILSVLSYTAPRTIVGALRTLYADSLVVYAVAASQAAAASVALHNSQTQPPPPRYVPSYTLLKYRLGVGVLGFLFSTFVVNDSLPLFCLLRDKLLKKLNRITSAPGLLISAFRSAEPPATPPVENHHHGISAGIRTAATLFMNSVIRATGFTPYSYQTSNFDQRMGSDGCRRFFWSRDLVQDPQLDELQEHHIRTLVDVDYYIEDMDRFLIDPVPTLIYTINPTSAARSTTEYSYNFDSENNLKYVVSGGCTFKHKLWNYNLDHFTVSKYIPYLRLPYRTTSYQVDRRTISLDRDVVCLTPTTSYGLLGSLIMLFIQSTPLSRFSVNQGMFTRFEIRTKDQHYVTTAPCAPDNYTSATIPVQADNYMANLSKTQSTSISPHNFQTYMNYPKEHAQLALSEAAIITSYYISRSLPNYRQRLAALSGYPKVISQILLCDMPPSLTIVHPVEHAGRKFTFGAYTSDKPMQEAFMSPFVDEGYVPLDTNGNEKRAVAGRITEVKTPEMEVTPFVEKTMNEFIDLLIPRKHQLHPSTQDQVYEKQNRPTQRSILNSAIIAPFIATSRRIAQFFVKSESYAKPSDPRLITIVQPAVKLEASEFMYPLSEHFLPEPWYGFGKDPNTTATRVADICRFSTKGVTESDYSRMDGRVSNVLRLLDRKILFASFAPEHHDRLTEVLESITCLSVYGKHGTKYLSDEAQLSGDPFTAIINSLRNLFIIYLTLRSQKELGQFNSPSASWAKIQAGALVGGDDGLSADLEKQPFTKACILVGQVLDYSFKPRGSTGVSFLSRFYGPGVWHGDINNCCDIKRQLIKFHLSAKLTDNVTPSHKLIEKARSFVITDANTPILGPYCSKVVALSEGIETPEAAKSVRTYASFAGEFTNQKADYMQQMLEEALPNLDQSLFEQWLEMQTTLEQLLSPPLLQPRLPAKPHATQTVIVDGYVLQPETQLLTEPLEDLQTTKPPPKKKDKPKPTSKKPTQPDHTKPTTSDQTRPPLLNFDGTEMMPLRTNRVEASPVQPTSNNETIVPVQRLKPTISIIPKNNPSSGGNTQKHTKHKNTTSSVSVAAASRPNKLVGKVRRPSPSAST